jgi:hypothetical protein
MDEGDTEARARLAASIRATTHALVGHEQDPAVLDRLGRLLDEALPELRAGERRTRDIEGWREQRQSGPPADGELFDDYPDRPVSGTHNPWSIPLVVRRDGERVVSTVSLDAAFEGAPGRSHGGVVSAIFDDLCGFVLTLDRVMAFTASLTVGYRAATPLHRPLTFACWLERRAGRKLYIAGTCHADDQLLTTCEALFVSVEGYLPPA